ncbi:VOC family protein [bacterium]|nr:VOC family protein [bacterium]
MLGTEDAVANIAVKDLDRARDFYEGKLGLKLLEQVKDTVLVFQSGGTSIFVYKSAYAGTNKATNVSWPVKDVEKTAKQLKALGVEFKHYTMPGLTLKGDVHVADDDHMQIAWFTDPEGNILSLVNG